MSETRTTAAPTSHMSTKRTAYAVDCNNSCGNSYLTYEGYIFQMDHPNASWRCPKCGGPAEFDDENYERVTR